ncbi:MAG: FAD-dependent oxidoreductase [Clostridia bacterium]|nr:FAD-dependent oxidoreductase [Clostridia bacterium]
MIKTDIKLPFSYSTDDIYSALAERIPVKREEITELKIVKRAIDLSDKSNIHYNATIAISLSPEREAGLLKMKKKVARQEDLLIDIPPCSFCSRPLVVGAGPAGLFAALLLAEAGAKPILIERGLPVDERDIVVDKFTTFGILDPECNIQFGEGGAGSYSDGKLKVGGMDKYKLKVLSDFIDAGAPEDIIYSVGAHVGTDKLKNIVKKIRQKIISLGGEVMFSTKLTSISVKDGRVVGAVAERGGECISFDTDALILATGHSARDVFEMLKTSGVMLEPKGFGIGLRIEHPREHIDRLMYGDTPPEAIGAASYHLVTHLPGGRSVYSFCMCPGGSVVAAASEQGGIVTNGMSEYARNADNSNAAFLVSVTPADFPSDDPLSGIELQRMIEQNAFKVSGGEYKAPSTTMGAFMRSESAVLGSVNPSYPIGTLPIAPEKYLPGYITDSLRAAIPDFDVWMPGFYMNDAMLTGPETRTTSPVRVTRSGSFEAIGIKGLYPTGEGAGYAGGIISSARDGLMVAESIILKNQK